MPLVCCTEECEHGLLHAHPYSQQYGTLLNQEMAECHLAHESRQELLRLRRVQYRLGLCPWRAGNLWCTCAAAVMRPQITSCLGFLILCLFLGFLQVCAAAWFLT